MLQKLFTIMVLLHNRKMSNMTMVSTMLIYPSAEMLVLGVVLGL